jgi:hypothetical protein
MSGRTDPNHLPLYIFTNCFFGGGAFYRLGGFGTAFQRRSAFAGLVGYSSRGLRLLLIMFHCTMSPTVNFCISIFFRKTCLLKLCIQYFVENFSFVIDSRSLYEICNRLLPYVWDFPFSFISWCSISDLMTE